MHFVVGDIKLPGKVGMRVNLRRGVREERKRLEWVSGGANLRRATNHQSANERPAASRSLGVINGRVRPDVSFG